MIKNSSQPTVPLIKDVANPIIGRNLLRNIPHLKITPPPPTRVTILYIIEEGRAASKSPHKKFGYFIFVSQQGVAADIIQN